MNSDHGRSANNVSHRSYSLAYENGSLDIVLVSADGDWLLVDSRSSQGPEGAFASAEYPCALVRDGKEVPVGIVVVPASPGQRVTINDVPAEDFMREHLDRKAVGDLVGHDVQKLRDEILRRRQGGLGPSGVR